MTNKYGVSLTIETPGPVQPENAVRREVLNAIEYGKANSTGTLFDGAVCEVVGVHMMAVESVVEEDQPAEAETEAETQNEEATDVEAQ